MYSPRTLAVFALLAVAAALPATDKPKNSPVPKPITAITDDDFDDSPWFSFPLFGNLFAPLWRLFPSFAEIGPRIIANDDKFQVIVSVKDYKKDDLKVKVKGDFIFVQGSHEAKQDDRDLFASQFFHTYTLPSNSSGSDVTAQLTSDGYLIVNAPLNGPVDRSKEADREVTIVETGTPYKEDKAEKTTTVQPPPSVTPELDDDKKESTTPSDQEAAKNNDIPHGNDILA